MTMRCDLSTAVEVRHLVVFAEMATLQRRPELGRLCRDARATGALEEDAILRALPGVSSSGARNLRRWGQSLELWDARGTLTKLGERAAMDDMCPVPEQGVYEWWIATHPLFGGTRLLHVDRRRATRDGRLDETDPLTEIPTLHVPFRSVVEPEETFLLRDLPRRDGGTPRGKLLGRGSHATIRWGVDFAAGTNEWRLEGEIAADPGGRERMQARRMQMRAESIPLDVAALFVEWARRNLPQETQWDRERRELLTPFPESVEHEQEQFLRAITFRNIEVPGRGEFATVELNDVPLAPITREDAQRWAEARLHRRLTAKPAYRSRADVRKVFSDAVRNTPLARHRPELPAHEALVRAHEGRSDVMWSLVAPVDLAPAPVGGSLLGAVPFSEEVTP